MSWWPRLRWRRGTRLIGCFFALCVSIAGCTRALPEGIVEVTPPLDLAALDVTVREQFNSNWKALDEESGGGKALGVAWGRMGQWFDAYRYDDSADRCYTNARLLDPEEGRWPYYQGLIAVQRGDLELAGKQFAKAAELAPEMPGPWVQLGDLAFAQVQLDAAESGYRNALKLDADNPGGLFGIGRVAIARNDPDAAIESLEHLLTLQPNASEVHYSLALAWKQLGDSDRFMQHMSKVPEDNGDQVLLVPRDPWISELNSLDRGAVALTRRAVNAANRGERGDAVMLFGQAAIADPKGPDKRINYAKALIAIGQTAGAVEQLQKALELAADLPESAARAHMVMATLYATHGQSIPAEAHYRAALDIDPLSVDAHIQLGRLLQARGNYEEALAEYATLRKIGSASTEVCFWHAAILVIVHRYDDARKAIEEDLERLGDDARLRQLLARVLVTTPGAMPLDIARARELLGVEKAPDAFFAETAAMLAAADGRFPEAEAWQRAAIAVLDGASTRLPMHIARRRLILYSQQLPCLNPWETSERVISRKIAPPVIASRGSR